MNATERSRALDAAERERDDADAALVALTIEFDDVARRRTAAIARLNRARTALAELTAKPA